MTTIEKLNDLIYRKIDWTISCYAHKYFSILKDHDSEKSKDFSYIGFSFPEFIDVLYDNAKELFPEKFPQEEDIEC